MDNTTDHECHPALSVCIDDFTAALENAGDWQEDVDNAKAELALAESFTADDWRFFADLVADYIWVDSFNEIWQDARDWALNQMKDYRKEQAA